MIDNGYQLEFHYNLMTMLSSMINDFKSLADTVIGVAMLVGLAITIRHIVRSDGKGKDAVIAWIISFGVWIVARSFFT
jgi:hypothetical protein